MRVSSLLLILTCCSCSGVDDAPPAETRVRHIVRVGRSEAAVSKWDNEGFQFLPPAWQSSREAKLNEREAVRMAFARASVQIAGCGVTSPGKVTVVFTEDGDVRSAAVTAGTHKQTTIACVERIFARAVVPPFSEPGDKAFDWSFH